jgi:subtilisin family serine protease
MRYAFFARPLALLALALVLSSPGTAVAGDKVAGRVADDITKHGKARVLIVMREPRLGEARSLAAGSPASFLQGVLRLAAKNISQIGSLPVASAEITADGLKGLRDNPSVAGVFDDTPMALSIPKNVSGASPLDLLDVSAAWSAGHKGQGQTIAILDTGVQYDHPYLKGKLVAEACFSTPSSDVYKVKSACPGGTDVSTVPGAGLPCDAGIEGCDHGTHVAGIAAGRKLDNNGKTLSGVAPEANLISIKIFTVFSDPDVCGGTGSCIRTFPSDQLRALSYVNDTLAQKFPIAAINMSVGSGRFESACDADSALTPVIQTLRSKGVATVVASGNDHFFNAISAPACVDSAVSVGATFPDKPEVDTSYSNTSPIVHFVAPGTDIVSSVISGFAAKSGTSMATPHVAGAFAVLKSSYSAGTVDAFESALRSSGKKVVDPRTNTSLTLIDVNGAVQSVGRTLVAAASFGAPAETSSRSVLKNGEGGAPSPAAGSRRVIIHVPAALLGAIRELSRHLGEGSIVSSAGPNTYIAEKREGISAQSIGQIEKMFGAGTKVYSDDPQKLQPAAPQ